MISNFVIFYQVNTLISKSIQKPTGTLIVIDGGDGSGKATQSKLLLEYFEKHNKISKCIDFPNYDTFFGKMVAQFLRGEFGTIEEVSPYLASLLYANDRRLAKKEIQQFLAHGGNIISDRYVTASMAHQGAKFTHEEEKHTFLEWIQQLEYKIHGMPKEDIVIYLYVPWKIAQELTKHKNERAYLNGGKEDIQEKDENHRQQSEKMYLELAEKNSHWVKIDCVENNKILSVQEIHKKIVQTLREKGIIK